MNASSRAILERLVRADTASAFNISVGDVKVTGVTQARPPAGRTEHWLLRCHGRFPVYNQLELHRVECNSMGSRVLCCVHAPGAALALHPGRP